MRQPIPEIADQATNRDEVQAHTTVDEPDELRVFGERLAADGLDQSAELLLRLGRPKRAK